MIHGSGRRWCRQLKAASQQSGSEFAELYSRIAGRRGKGIATTALAREMLTEVWKIILTGKEYVEHRVMKRTKYRLKKGVVENYDADKVAAILSTASTVTGIGLRQCWWVIPGPKGREASDPLLRCTKRARHRNELVSSWFV